MAMQWKTASRLAATILLAAVFAGPAHAVIIDMTTVGNAGNAADSTTYGAVSTTYNISKYEVSNAQYAEFLNAVAATDTYALYNTSMGSQVYGGITRSGVSGSYTYTVKSGYANLPVVYTSFYDAIRFINWLDNGQGAGSTETGAYTITGGGANSGTIGSRNGGAEYWLPSEDEWYKAAYYQPVGAGGPSDSYWLYPMQTDSVPTSEAPAGGSTSGNFYDGGYAVGSPAYLSAVGAYTTADSYYGTFDQGGNVWEWNEAIIGSSRGLRGGSWLNNELNLRASSRLSYGPANELANVGFRVAGLFSEVSAVPEPTTGLLWLVGGLVLWRWGRKPR